MLKVIEPKLMGNIARSVHPIGCQKNVNEQIEYVKNNEKYEGPKNVLVLGASSSYGLASRISLAFGANANTIGVSFERGIKDENNLGTAGWWNNIYFSQQAKEEGLLAPNFIGDAFSNQMKTDVIRYIKEELDGKIDLIVYSLASPKRFVESEDKMYSSALKPIGEAQSGKNIVMEDDSIIDQAVEAATQEEIDSTVKVMGGEDWLLWIEQMIQADVLSHDFKTVNYSYIGPEVTQAFYNGGTLGRAKMDAYEKSLVINQLLADKGYNGESVICVSKAVTTKASAVIPTLPFYLMALYKVMEAKNIHETPIMHKHRFFSEMLYGNKREVDELGRLRPDSWELRDDVQAEVKELMAQITADNFNSDLTGYSTLKKEFMQLNGFEQDGVDYTVAVDLDELSKLLP